MQAITPHRQADRATEPVEEGTRFPIAAGSDGAAVVSAPISDESPQAVSSPNGESQDLTAIRGVDAATAVVLNREGVARYAQIAAWTEGDVARINRSLGGMRRAQQENWIEQAAVLAAGRETSFLKRRNLALAGKIEPAIDVPPAATENISGAAKTSEIPSDQATGPDDLTLIRGIDAATQTALARLGVVRFADIAAWSAQDVRRINDALGSARRVQQENWIEQAGMLAGGATSSFARAGGTGSFKLVQPESAAPATRSVATVGSASTAHSAAPFPPSATMVDIVGDDLTMIDGINTEVEKALKGQGITRFSHVAALEGDAATRLDRLLGVAGRVERENWSAQAKALMGDAAVLPPAASMSASAIAAVPAAAAVPTAADGIDDLKRIRGVGALLERKLNAMGFVRYVQVANWTASDIDRVSQQLDFRGRIERENWVEQARILSSGGQTGFSKRFDRGVE